RLALGEEEVALRLGLRRVEQLDEQLALPLHPFVEGQVDRRLHRLDAVLGGPEAARLPGHRFPELGEDLRLAAGGRDLVGEVADLLERALLVEHLLGEGDTGGGEITVHDLVDEAVAEGLVSADRITAHDHRERLLRADDAWQALRAASAGQKAELHLAEPAPPGLHADAIVAGEGHLEAAAERGAVNGGDDGLRRALDEVEHRVEPRLRGRLAEFRDVGARDEGPPGARDDDRLDVLVGDGLLHPIVEAAPHVLAERVDGRVVDGQHGHAAAPVEVDGFRDLRHGCPRRAWMLASMGYVRRDRYCATKSVPTWSI